MLVDGSVGVSVGDSFLLLPPFALLKSFCSASSPRLTFNDLELVALGAPVAPPAQHSEQTGKV